MLELKYMACDFNEVDSNEGHSFDEQAFRKYLEKPETQSLIKRKVLFGGLSHKCRTDFEDYMNEEQNPAIGDISDYLLDSGQACTSIVNAEISNHKLFLTVETLPTERGLVLEALIDRGVDLQVSMSTELELDEESSKYIIINLFGLDHTVSPAFSTKLVSMKRK